MKMYDRERLNVLGVLLDHIDYCEACQRLNTFLKSYDNKIIVTPNAEIIMAAQNSLELKAALNKADMCLPDGIGVVIASRILGDPLFERTTGFDFMIKMLHIVAEKELSLFLLGGRSQIAQKAGEKIKNMFPDIQVAGFHHGYFDKDYECKIVEIINDKQPDVILVAMGCPKQELFMMNNKDKLRFRVAMGVGGSFDVLAGTVRRAPVFMQKAGLEWLYRLLAQPSRFKRISALPLFLIKTMIYRMLQHNTKKIEK